MFIYFLFCKASINGKNLKTRESNKKRAILIVTSSFVRRLKRGRDSGITGNALAALPHCHMAIIIIYGGNPALHLSRGQFPASQAAPTNTDDPRVWTKLIWYRLLSWSPGPRGPASGGRVGSLTPGLTLGPLSTSFSRHLKIKKTGVLETYGNWFLGS